MTVWSHLPTILKRRLALRIAGLIALCVALNTTLLFGAISHATTGVNQTLSFQGRLLTSTGGTVPDGNYNIQFKIYQDGNSSGSGTLKWTEDHINNGGTSGIQVKNGYFSVDLGAVTPFGSSVDWNQDTLWLSMNVGGSSASCTSFGTAPCVGDGEMLPMRRINSVPQAINSQLLGGIASSGFLQNTTSAQTADFNITGSGTADTLQGTTSISAPLFDRASSGTLSIGTVNATTINVGTNNIDHTINIGTGTGDQVLTLGSSSSDSKTTLKGGSLGVRVETSGGFAVHTNQTGQDSIVVDQSGNINLNNSTNGAIKINTSVGYALMTFDDNGISTGNGTPLTVNGPATFGGGISIQGTGSNVYTTPGGYNMSTAIAIQNYAVPDFGSVFAFGLPSTSSATARGLMVADGRTGSHQATIGILSPDESAIMGLSWNGSNSTGYITNMANSLALQGNGLNLLTATNNSGAANVGIGNAATSGYALDVTGDTNTSGQYRINGTTTLSSSELTFSGNTGSVITSASNQTLTLNGQNGLTVQSNSLTSAQFSESNVQIGDGTDSSALTLLTLDQASAAPDAGSSILGSMYYDTTLGKVQCYEASGWGNCGSAPDSFVSLSPEFANSVMNGSGNGTMSSDLCSDSLNINDGSSSQPTICDTNETYNFYKWTSSQSTAQTKSIFVTYQLPTSFKEFVAGTTSLSGRVDSTTNADVSYQVYRKDASGLTACGSSITVATSANTWQKVAATSTADPANCSFEAGDSIVIKVTASAKNDANAYISDLSFVYSNND